MDTKIRSSSIALNNDMSNPFFVQFVEREAKRRKTNWPRTFLGTRVVIFAPGISHSRFFLTLFLSLHSKAKVEE